MRGYCQENQTCIYAIYEKHNDTQVNGKTVRIEMINCEENETNAKLAQQFGVKGYPTSCCYYCGNDNHMKEEIEVKTVLQPG